MKERSSQFDRIILSKDLATQEPSQPDKAPVRRMEYLPVALFGSVMGLAGLSASWREASTLYNFSAEVSGVIGIVAILAFAALLAAYGIKITYSRDAVQAEFVHPTIGSLFGTVFISLLLLPTVITPLSLRLAQAIWITGAFLTLAFAFFILNRWMSSRQQLNHAAPAWNVPVAGLLNIPLSLPGLGLPPMHGLMMACLAIGLFFTIPLFTIIFSRLVFEAPLQEAVRPTLLILVAPFAAGFLSYVSLIGTVDTFAQGLFGLTLFMLALLVGRLRWLLVCCPFRLSWWAVGFPVAAVSLAALRYAEARPHPISHATALSLLVFATVVIAALSTRTLIGIARGELRALSE